MPEEQLAPRLAHSLRLAACWIESGELRKHLVAAHADQRAHLLEGNDVPVRAQRVDPHTRMRVVAVDQRAVDVQQNGAERRAGRTWGLGHAASRSRSVPAYPPVSRRVHPVYLSPPMTSTAPAEPRPTGTPERRRWVDWLLGLLWIGAIVAATLQQGVARQNNNFQIFRAASRHLIAGSDLYAAYPSEHFDFYKYSPTFALLFAPFAYVPFPLAMLLWNALNAGALYVALRLVLPRRAARIARVILFLDMLGSLQNAQSNALVAA